MIKKFLRQFLILMSWLSQPGKEPLAGSLKKAWTGSLSPGEEKDYQVMESEGCYPLIKWALIGIPLIFYLARYAPSYTGPVMLALMLYIVVGYGTLVISTRKKRKAQQEHLNASHVLFLSRAQASLLRSILLNAAVLLFMVWFPLKEYRMIDIMKEYWHTMSSQLRVEAVAFWLSYVISMASVLLSVPLLLLLNNLAVTDRKIIAGERAFPLSSIEAVEIAEKPLTQAIITIHMAGGRTYSFTSRIYGLNKKKLAELKSVLRAYIGDRLFY